MSRLGAVPVFVDVDDDTLMMEAAAVDAAITPRTKAIIPVHLFGLCADMDPIIAVASRHGLAVVEDAAQALGASYRGRRAGTMGALACFSFFPSKNLGAFGDAGLVTTNDAALAARVRRLRNHGAEARYFHEDVGGNFRLDALQAAVLRVKLPHVSDWNEQRRANARRYRQLFAPVREVRLPAEPGDRIHTYHQYVIRVRDRDRVRAHLASRGVGTEVYYPLAFHRQKCFASLRGVSPEAFPIADRAVLEVLALPVFPGLSAAQQAYVATSVVEALQ